MKRTALCLLITALILTACTAVTPSPAPTATPTPVPTLPPQQVGGLEGVPDPRAAAPELLDLRKSDAPIPQFVNAMKMGGIEVEPQEVANNLQYQAITGADGKQYVIASFNLDPNPNKKGETLEGPIPLMIWGEERWREYDINTGFILNGKELSTSSESGWADINLRNAVEQGWRYFPNRAVTNTGEETTYHPSDPNRLNGEKLSLAEKFIKKIPGRITGGHLVWGYNGSESTIGLPQYYLEATPQDRLNLALNHIDQVMSYFYNRFPGKKWDWTVVAEATSGNLFRPLGLRLDDPDNSWVILSYRKANEVINRYGRVRGDDGDRLAYSDFITSLQDPHIPGIISILKALHEEGLIDVFHLQIRYGPNLNPNNPLTASQLSRLIDRIAEETGVPTQITELGFNNASQRAVTYGFAEATEACLITPNCVGIQFDKVLPERNQNVLFSFVNGNAVPDQDYYAVLQKTFNSLTDE